MLPRNRGARFLLTPLREGRRTVTRCRLILYIHFYSRPCGRGDPGLRRSSAPRPYFYSRPCGRGDTSSAFFWPDRSTISTHAPAGGATGLIHKADIDIVISTHAPAGGATRPGERGVDDGKNFYSRPCGRGDCDRVIAWRIGGNFYSRPCGRGDPTSQPEPQRRPNFYSRPCGRGDPAAGRGQ